MIDREINAMAVAKAEKARDALREAEHLFREAGATIAASEITEALEYVTSAIGD